MYLSCNKILKVRYSNPSHTNIYLTFNILLRIKSVKKGYENTKSSNLVALSLRIVSVDLIDFLGTVLLGLVSIITLDSLSKQKKKA